MFLVYLLVAFPPICYSEYDKFLEDYKSNLREKPLGDSSSNIDMYGSQEFELDNTEQQVEADNVIL